MTTNAEQPAYPVLGHNTGLTKREYFAAMAMQGLISGQLAAGNVINFPTLAKQSIEISDELLKQLENNKP